MNLKTSLYGALMENQPQSLLVDALYFKGKTTSYQTLYDKIDRFAASLKALNVNQDTCVTICMPNVPQTIVAIYAVNRLGAKLSIVHPLTPYNQLKDYMKLTKSTVLIILDIAYKHFSSATKEYTTIIASIKDELPLIKSYAYRLTIHKDVKTIIYGENVYKMNDLLKAQPLKEAYNQDYKKVSVYLHSAGTTGKSKTICLNDHSINQVAQSSLYIVGKKDNQKTYVLGILPMFHGFGLAMNCHNMLITKGAIALVPRYEAKEVIELINDNKSNIIIGVPSLFYSLMKDKDFNQNKNLKNIHHVFVGGDFITVDFKKRFNQVLSENGSKARILEGYGLTETVTVNTVNLLNEEKINSVGKPLPGVTIKIVDPQTKKELKINQEGEIAINTEAMMMGYLDDEETTKEVLRKDDKGKTFLYTGDFGSIDKDGYVYLKSRIKRIIKVSGVQVFPSMIESLVLSLKEVDKVCAVGVNDDTKGSVIKLYVTLKEEYKSSEELTGRIIKLCQENLIRHAVPKGVVYLNNMPLTAFNKIDYRALEKYE